MGWGKPEPFQIVCTRLIVLSKTQIRPAPGSVTAPGGDAVLAAVEAATSVRSACSSHSRVGDLLVSVYAQYDHVTEFR